MGYRAYSPSPSLSPGAERVGPQCSHAPCRRARARGSRPSRRSTLSICQLGFRADGARAARGAARTWLQLRPHRRRRRQWSINCLKSIGRCACPPELREAAHFGGALRRIIAVTRPRANCGAIWLTPGATSTAKAASGRGAAAHKRSSATSGAGGWHLPKSRRTSMLIAPASASSGSTA